MLLNTFLHLPGIGRKKEQALWQSGVLTWNDYLRAYPSQKGLFEGLPSDRIEAAIVASQHALSSGDMDFFAERLPKQEHYRIALTVPEQTAFLDIETTGLSFFYDHITVVGYSIRDSYHCYIRGTDKRKRLNALRGAKCLVTFNGTNFDLKFLKNEFPNLCLPKAHVDLRYLVRAAKLAGGQKIVEQKMGIARPRDIADVVGERAPLLWHDYRMGDDRAGKTLVRYNFADIEGMKAIFDKTVELFSVAKTIPSSLPHTEQFANGIRKINFVPVRDQARKNAIFVPKYQGKRGPKIKLSTLLQGSSLAPIRIVGIDLTGSEIRPSGWALLDGNHATTKTLKTDAELLVETISSSPTLVSIDSPLSLPKGRMRVTDDDPRRHEIGIMRRCERVLKSRGVNVYPCLIPSMQQLTARGIRLATQFRSLGMPVIESYPGAAQDIMDIPRKRSGIDHLAKGLHDFGINGDFAAGGASHDELDAITSAIVGLFFWSGRFEALGNEDEDYLIIPDLDVSPSDWLNRRAIGISGPIAAGKTTSARYLEKNGFTYARYSLVLQKILEQRGISINRESLQQIGEEINKYPGQRWLSHQVANSVAGDRLVVVDGMRFPEDHATLTEVFGPAFTHVYVHASLDTRRSRFLGQRSRNRVSDFNAWVEHPVEKKVKYLRSLSEIRINNEFDEKSLTEELDQIINGAHLLGGGTTKCR